jgi:hypothetical protein
LSIHFSKIAFFDPFVRLKEEYATTRSLRPDTRSNRK